MIFAYMILTALMPTAKGLMGCNISQTTEAQQCVGALGEPLIFNQPTNTTSITLKKDQTTILNIVNNRVTILDQGHQGVFTLITNGSLQLIKALKKHSGDYLWEVFDSSGKTLYIIQMHLEIQVPVSEPAVSQTCLSPEQMDVSCSSEGDQVEFSLSLDHHLLIQTRTHIQSERNWTVGTQSLTTDKQDNVYVPNVSISLYGWLTGNLICRVWNNVSRDEKVIHLKSCKDVAPGCPALTVALKTSVAVLLLLMALCAYLNFLRKTRDP